MRSNWWQAPVKWICTSSVESLLSILNGNNWHAVSAWRLIEENMLGGWQKKRHFYLMFWVAHSAQIQTCSSHTLWFSVLSAGKRREWSQKHRTWSLLPKLWWVLNPELIRSNWSEIQNHSVCSKDVLAKPSCINGGFQSSLAHFRCPCVWANQKQNHRKLLIYGGDIPYRDTPIEHSFSLILVPSSFLVISCNSIFWNSKKH